ncbi:flagellar motor stator protein MotA [Salipiger mucosus]|uniref:Flagellar motor rotation protein MotA n=1 Tax=Salipiger mucosus DSM 16094 TaxID=1123237 RepID=S9QDP3_9RHOB|nr:flagellar motor stator protein MotA [Salipiger mucosus]EPX78032.1 Flagellar motor rotation protein MotA [Salipiger mucosus DSM 16094]
MFALLGFILVFGSVLGGFAAMGGNLWVLWQPWELVIIIGAALGAFVIANPKSVLRDTFKACRSVLRGKPYNKAEYLEMFSLLYMLFKVSKDDLRKIEKDLDSPNRSSFFKKFPLVSQNPRNVRFIADYFRLFLLGSSKSHEMEALLDTELDSIERELNRVPNALYTVADSLPALGIVAAVLGVIKAMGSINQPPEVLGMLIGGALVGTFLGVLLSYGVVGPLANAIRARGEQELAYYIAIKTSIIAFLNDYPPQICAEYGRKTISADVRPAFEEVEKATYEAAKKTGINV